MTIIYLTLFARGGTVAIEAVATCSLGGAKRMVNGIELIMLMIHFVENVAMIIPAVFTSCNVVVYHQSLPYTNEEENAAYELAW